MMWEVDDSYRRRCREVLKHIGIVFLAILYWAFWGTVFSLLFARSDAGWVASFFASVFMFPIGIMILRFVQVLWGAIFGRQLFTGFFGELIDGGGN